MTGTLKDISRVSQDFTRYVENVSIVLVEPLGAGNIGSVARVMHNTGFNRLILVNPVEYMNDEGFSMACNASDILLKAVEFSTLEEAIGPARFVVASTRRKGKLRRPHFTLADAVPMIIERAVMNDVAIVFGRENHGLNNDELALCDMLFEIPAHIDNPSFNLSQAALCICHALFCACNPTAEAIELAPRDEVLKLFVHLESTLARIGYGEPRCAHVLESIMHNFRRLFGRTGLMPKEVNMLRGILTNIDVRVSEPNGEESVKHGEQ